MVKFRSCLRTNIKSQTPLPNYKTEKQSMYILFNSGIWMSCMRQIQTCKRRHKKRHQNNDCVYEDYHPNLTVPESMIIVPRKTKGSSSICLKLQSLWWKHPHNPKEPHWTTRFKSRRRYMLHVKHWYWAIRHLPIVQSTVNGMEWLIDNIWRRFVFENVFWKCKGSILKSRNVVNFKNRIDFQIGICFYRGFA